MNEWQLVHGHWAFLPPPGVLLLLHSLVEQALLGHSIIHDQHSAVMSKGNSFRHMELMSKWNACIFLFITHVLDEKILDGTQSRISKNLMNFIFPKT
jgi:hypothetical protein